MKLRAQHLPVVQRGELIVEWFGHLVMVDYGVAFCCFGGWLPSFDFPWWSGLLVAHLALWRPSRCSLCNLWGRCTLVTVILRRFRMPRCIFSRSRLWSMIRAESWVWDHIPWLSLGILQVRPTSFLGLTWLILVHPGLLGDLLWLWAFQRHCIPDEVVHSFIRGQHTSIGQEMPYGHGSVFAALLWSMLLHKWASCLGLALWACYSPFLDWNRNAWSGLGNYCGWVRWRCPPPGWLNSMIFSCTLAIRKWLVIGVPLALLPCWPTSSGLAFVWFTLNVTHGMRGGLGGFWFVCVVWGPLRFHP